MRKQVFMLMCSVGALVALSDVKKDGSLSALTQRYLKRFDASVCRADVGSAIRLLDELDAVSIWSFGAGVGPTTAESLQYRIVMWALDSEKQLRQHQGQLPTDASFWTKMFSEPLTNQTAMIRLLREKNAARRLIGLRTAMRQPSWSPDLVDAVKRVRDGDEYWQIIRVPHVRDCTMPLVLHATESELVMPLRDLARGELEKRGIACQHDKLADAMAGVVCMARNWVLRTERRMDYEDAVALLPPESVGAKAIRACIHSPDIRPAVEAFINALSHQEDVPEPGPDRR